MYVQSNGEIQKKENAIIFKKNNSTAFEIEGKDADFFYELFPYLTGTISLEKLLEFSNGIKKNKFVQAIEELSNHGIVSLKKRPFIDIFIISDTLAHNELVRLFNNSILIDTIKFGKLENIKPNSVDIVIALEKDDNKSYFKKVDVYLKNLQIPWIKYSFNNSKIFIGPIFFHDGGPCYECFNTRLMRNNNEHNWEMSTGSIKNYLAPFIEKEILKFSNPMYPTLCFNTEIVFDTNNLEITKYSVYKIPNCNSCGDECYV